MTQEIDSLEKIQSNIIDIYHELNDLRDNTPVEIQKIPNQLRKVLPSIEKIIGDYRDALIFYNHDDKENLNNILKKY